MWAKQKWLWVPAAMLLVAPVIDSPAHSQGKVDLNREKPQLDNVVRSNRAEIRGCNPMSQLRNLDARNKPERIGSDKELEKYPDPSDPKLIAHYQSIADAFEKQGDYAHAEAARRQITVLNDLYQKPVCKATGKGLAAKIMLSKARSNYNLALTIHYQLPADGTVQALRGKLEEIEKFEGTLLH